MGNDNQIPKPIAVLIGSITSLIAFITAIVGFILLWQGNAKIVSAVVIIVGITGLWASFFYIRFSRKSADKNKEFSLRQNRKKQKKVGFSFSPKIRLLALIGIYAIPTLVLSGVGIYYYKINQPANGLVILIADFDGPDPQKYGVSQFFAEKITEITKSFNYVHVVTLGHPITATQGLSTAANIAKQEKADIVIWGWYVATDAGINVTYHTFIPKYTTILQTDYPSDLIKNFGATTDKTETFDFQSNELADNLVYDTLDSISSALSSKVNDVRDCKDLLDIYSLKLNYLQNNRSSFSNYSLLYSAALSGRGKQYYCLSEFDKALDDFNTAVQATPSFNAYISRGVFYIRSGDSQKAEDDFRESLNYPALNDTQYSAAYINLGNLYYNEKRYNDSVAILTRGLESIEFCTLDYQCEGLYFMRGLSYIQLGMKENARADFEKVKNLVNDPGTSSYLDSLLEQTK